MSAHKHLVRDSCCLQPYTKAPGTRDRVVPTAPRVWMATTWCGLGFHGSGAFPHAELRHRADEEPGWCEECFEDKSGVRASERLFVCPDLRTESDAHPLADKMMANAGPMGTQPEGDPLTDAQLSCQDCGATGQALYEKSNHHGGTKRVCADRDACHIRMPG